MKKSYSKVKTNESIIQECINLLRREDLKYELKLFLEPIITMVFNTINPYIYIFLGITVIILGLLIAILVLIVSLMRSK